MPESQIPCKGISKLQLADFTFADSVDSTIKLIGSAASSDGKLTVHVTPVMVSRKHMLATARGAGNCVAVDSENMGLTIYAGPGAGRFPTANSVVADILRVASGMAGPLCPKQTDSLVIDDDFESSFYIRLSSTMNPFIPVGQVAEKTGITVTNLSVSSGSVIIMTNVCKVSQVEALCAELVKGGVSDGEPVFMPVIAT